MSHLPIEIVSAPAVDSQLSALATAFCLHAGEISALSFARTKSDVLFITDDAAARLAARQMNLRVRGKIFASKGELVVFIEDECHLLWGDVCG